MHEVSICQSIIDRVEKEMHEELESIREIHVEVGELSCIQPKFLEHVYGYLVPEGPLKNSRLKVEQIGIVAFCDHCKFEFEVKAHKFICPNCNSPTANILKGKEMKIVKIILEDLSYEEAHK